MRTVPTPIWTICIRILAVTLVIAGVARATDIARSAVSQSVVDGDIKALQQLLAAGANPNERDLDGQAPLTIAADNGHADMIDVLLRASADANIVNKNGDTALKIAAKRACYECVETLLRSGANPNIAGEDGRTALVAAIYKERSDIVRVLLKYGANPNLRVRATKLYFDQLRRYSSHDPVADARGTALMAARMTRNEEIVSLLVEAGAVDEPPDAQTILKKTVRLIARLMFVFVALTVLWSLAGLVLLWKLLKRPTDDTAEKQRHDVLVSFLLLPVIALTWALMYLPDEHEAGMILFVWPPAAAMLLAALVLSIVSTARAIRLRTGDIVFNSLAVVNPAFWIWYLYLVLFGFSGYRVVIPTALAYVFLCVLAAVWLSLKYVRPRRPTRAR